MKARYLNPFTDFGFKKLFGEEASKPLLMDFLNALLPLEFPITELSFRNVEQLGVDSSARRAVYDIYCQDSQGNYFIVEMQKAKQNFFKDRAVFYTTFPIREQAEKGDDWNFELKAVYCVGILDFVFEEDKHNPDYVHEVKLKNQHNQVFYNKYALYFIEMPKFHKVESELASQLENWLYVIKHLQEFPDVPERFQHTILEQAFERAELANLSQEERTAYEHSLMLYRDLLNVVDTAATNAWAGGKEEGLAEGLMKGKEEGLAEGLVKGELKGEQKAKLAMARQFKKDGMALDWICKYTGLTSEELDEL